MDADAAPPHVDRAAEFAESSAEYQRMERALALIESGVTMIPDVAWEDTFANDYAARVCLTVAARHLRGCSFLAFMGYYPETRVLLRAAYESAGLARVLAKEPQLAERWLQRQEWFPDRQVRAWLRDARDAPDETVEIFRAHYRRASAWTHPTAVSTASVVDFNDVGPRMMLAPQFDAERYTAICGETAATAIFACFAMRNSAADESAINPDWRKAVYELAREISGDDVPHLERDWQRENDLYEAVRQRVEGVDELDERLASHPMSWQNLRASVDQADEGSAEP